MTQADRYRKYGENSIAIDFDNTITSNIKGGCYDWRNLPKPKKDIIKKIKNLNQIGLHIIIHTARLNKQWGDDIKIVKAMIEKYLNHYHIPFDDVIGKPYCKYYVGDGYFDELEKVIKKIKDLTNN